MKKAVAVMVALAMMFSASVVWAGNGSQNQTRKHNRVAAGTCVQQQGPGQARLQVGRLNGKHYGPGDGTGYNGDGPKDGTGYGRTGGLRSGTGTCDGTGPHGTTKRSGGPGGGR